MSKQTRNKKRLFEIYSRNFSWLKQHPKVSSNQEFGEGCLCPLCCNFFSPADVHELTFDHNPPKSLGGIKGVLTCKSCNSKCGHQIDNHLLQYLEERDFAKLVPNSRARTRIKSGDSVVTTDISINERGDFCFNIDSRNSNQMHAKNFWNNKTYSYKLFDSFLKGHDLHESGFRWNMNVSFDVPYRSSERKASIALLKIAYLYAFQKFGHSFLANVNLKAVRNQIMNPEQEILPKVFWMKYPFEEQYIGLNIVSEPAALSCFLIIFDLSTRSGKKKFAMALPGLTSPGIDVYSNIEALLCRENGFVNLKLHHLPDQEYVQEEKCLLDAYKWWKHLTDVSQ